MMVSGRQAQRIEELRQIVSARQDVYERAVARVKGEDKEWLVRRPLLEKQLCDLILSFSAGDSGDKAIYILGDARRIALELRTPYEVISTQERERKTLSSMLARSAEERDTDNDG